MSLADEIQKFERRVRDAPEVLGLEPIGQTSRYQVATFAVLIDLLLSTIHPDHFDRLFLTPLEEDVERGDAEAMAQMRWLRLWTAGTDSLAISATDAEVAELLESGLGVVNRLFLLAGQSNEQTGEPRFAVLISDAQTDGDGTRLSGWFVSCISRDCIQTSAVRRV